MDTMKLLLGATIALLLGALAVSWQGMSNGVKNTPKDEMARLEGQIKELKADMARMALEKQIQTQPVAADAAEIELMKQKVEQGKQELADIEKEKAARDKLVDDQEELLKDVRDVEGKDPELRRARMIAEALLIGKVAEYIENPEMGGFVTFSIEMPEQVQVGTILAIRRKTGILGQLKVSDVTPEGGIANPMGGFGAVKPQAGDELILPPPY
jgi:hypothetical protein